MSDTRPLRTVVDEIDKLRVKLIRAVLGSAWLVGRSPSVGVIGVFEEERRNDIMEDTLSVFHKGA